jgi:hypothetical protein
VSWFVHETGRLRRFRWCSGKVSLLGGSGRASSSQGVEVSVRFLMYFVVGAPGSLVGSFV